LKQWINLNDIFVTFMRFAAEYLFQYLSLFFLQLTIHFTNRCKLDWNSSMKQEASHATNVTIILYHIFQDYRRYKKSLLNTSRDRKYERIRGRERFDKKNNDDFLIFTIVVSWVLLLFVFTKRKNLYKTITVWSVFKKFQFHGLSKNSTCVAGVCFWVCACTE